MNERTLTPRSTPGASVEALSTSNWRLQIPPGTTKSYCLAQLDDYHALSRGKFPHTAPGSMVLRARAARSDLVGTWGFGLWNDPFGLALPSASSGLRLPTLPNAAWFFYASPKNYLSFDDRSPGNGWLAATFRSANMANWLAWLGLPALGLLVAPAGRRLLRRLARRFIQQDGVRLTIDLVEWHIYRLEWQEQSVSFFVDEVLVYQTAVAPRGRLGLVIWIDNQYAAWKADGSLGWGNLNSTESGWIEIENLKS
jgi:hypothetical protein